MVTFKRSGKGTLIANVVMVIISTISVTLRMIAKAKLGQSFLSQDFFILLGLVMFYVYVFVTLYAMIYAGGTLSFPEMDSLDTISIVLKCIYTLEILMGTILTLVKVSILLWYRTVFSTQAVRVPTMIVGVLCLVWYLITLFVIVFQCNPVQAVWDFIAAQTDQCTDIGIIILGYEISNILLDVSILCIPIAVIRTLHLSIQKKITLLGIFLLGGFICVTCIIRVAYLYHPTDPGRVDIYRGLLWSTIELGVAILCACLPTLRPLFPRDFFSSPSPFRPWYAPFLSTRNISSSSSSSSTKRSVSRTGNKNSESSRYMNLENQNITLYQLGPRRGAA